MYNLTSTKFKNIAIISSYILLMILFAIFFTKYINQESLREVINRSGNIGIFIYVFIEIIYVTFTPLLNTFILIASGYIFGGHIGFIINLLSTITGLFLIVFLVKKYGRPLLQKIISKKYYDNFDTISQKIGPLALLIIYVLPFTPDDEFTYILAAGSVSFKRFIIPIVLGSIAKSAYSYIGDLGAQGIIISVYFRVAMLILGIIVISYQEYFWGRK